MYKIISTNEVNDGAAAFIVPDQQSFRQKLFYNTLNTALSDTSSPKDVRLLTKGDIDSFAKQKSAIMKDCHGRGAFVLSALALTVAAVAAFTLAYFFAPVILFAVAGALVVGGLTLAGLAIHRHVEYNKKIKALADSINPVKQQLALAERAGSNIKSLSTIDYTVLSNAEKVKTESTDLILLGELNKATYQSSQKINQEILTSLQTAFIPYLTKGDKSSRNVLDFYKALLKDLEEHPISEKAISDFRLIDFYKTSILKRGLDLPSMIAIMQFVNSRVCSYKFPKKISNPQILINLEYGHWNHIIQLVADGKHQAADVLLAADLVNNRIAYFKVTPGTCPNPVENAQRGTVPFHEYLYGLQLNCIEPLLGFIENNTAQDDREAVSKLVKEYVNAFEFQTALTGKEFSETLQFNKTQSK